MRADLNLHPINIVLIKMFIKILFVELNNWTKHLDSFYIAVYKSKKVSIWIRFQLKENF